VWKNLQLTLSKWCFGWQQQQLFLDNIHRLLEDGVPVHQAVDAIESMSSGVVRQVAQHAQMSLAQGQLFADGLHGWYAPHVVAMIRAGELGGAFVATIGSAQVTLSSQHRLLSTALAALVYPCLVLLMGCAVAIFLQHSVFHSFAEIKPVALWPANGQSLYVFSSFLQHSWWVLCLLMLVCAMAWCWMLRYYTGALRQQLDRWPVFSLYRRAVAAQFMEVMGLMLTNGIALREALQLSQRHATVYLSWHVLHMEVRLSGGLDNIADVLDTGLLGQVELAQLRVVAKGAGFAKALVRLGRHTAEHAQRHAVWLVRVLAAGLLVLAAYFASYMILAIYAVGSFIGT
jgi:type II secretory pathway component PulF